MKQIQPNQIEWKEVRLNELTECLDNKRIPINGEEREKIQGDIPYYGANGQLDSINRFIFDEELLLIAEDGGSWGYQQKCAYIIEGKSWVNNHAHVLKIKKDKTNINFLTYWFNLTNLNKFISGSTRGKLNQKAMNSIKIPIPFSNGKPNIKEQERIVSILEKAETLKQKGKNAEELLNEYLKNIFYEMFLKEKGKFKEVKLKEVVLSEKNSLKRGPFGGSLKKEIFVNKGFKIYEQQNAIYDNCLRGDYYITSNKFEEMRDFSVKPGDIIISCSGTIGRLSILPKNCPKGIINQALLKISLDNKKISPLFFRFLFESQSTQDKLFGFSHGSGIKNFPPMSNIRNLDIPFPPLLLQQKFASIVEQVEKMKENVNKTKQNSEELFNSLVSKGFRGEL